MDIINKKYWTYKIVSNVIISLGNRLCNTFDTQHINHFIISNINAITYGVLNQIRDVNLNFLYYYTLERMFTDALKMVIKNKKNIS